MKTPDDKDVQNLESLGLSKLNLLKVLHGKMSATLASLKNGNADGLSDALDEQQSICSNIDSIDEVFTPTVRALDTEIANVILSFQTSSNKKYVPSWGTKLFNCVKEQQELLVEISDLQKELTALVEALSLEYQEKLKNIQSQKSFIKKYATNKNIGSFMDFKK